MMGKFTDRNQGFLWEGLNQSDQIEQTGKPGNVTAEEDNPVLSSTSPADQLSDLELPPLSVQGLFDFMEVPTLPLFSKEEQAEATRAVVEQWNLHGMNLKKFLARPPQIATIDRIFSYEGPLLVEAETGLGKTIIALACMLNAKSRSLRAIHVAAQRKLGTQSQEMVEEFIESGATTAAVINGSIPAKRRAKKYAERPQTIFVTKHTLEIDAATIFDWSDIGIIIFDEPQEMQTRSGSLALAGHLRKERPEIRQLALSATLARDEGRLTALRHSFGWESRIVKVSLDDGQKPEEEEVPPDVRVGSAEKPLTEPATDEIYSLKLDPALSKLVLAVRDQANRCMQTIKDELDTNKLFGQRKDLPLWLPPFEARERVFDKLTVPFHKSLLAEAHLWCDFFNRAAYLGRFAALERFAYLHAKTHLSPDEPLLFLREIEGPIRKEERGTMSLAHKRLVGNEAVSELVYALAKGTIYEPLFKRQSWAEVMEACQPAFAELRQTEDFSALAERRKQRLIGLNAKLDPNDQETKQARWFFEGALRYMARHAQSDHPKMAAALELIEDHYEIIQSSPGFIFSASGRHTEFLVEVLHHHFFNQGKGLIIDGVHGKMPEKDKRQTLQRFKDGGSNLLALTIQFGGTGLDATNPRFELIYAISNGDASKIHQARGRVINRALEPFHLFALATSGTLEEKWHETAPEKIEKRNQMVREKSAMVFPTFRVS